MRPINAINRGVLAFLMVLCSGCASEELLDSGFERRFNLSNAVSDGRVDLALLGLQNPNYNCKGIVDAIADVNEVSIAILDRTFGSDTTCLGRLARNPRVKRFEIHLINETCMRANRTCQSHEFMYGRDLSAYNRLLEARDRALMNEVDGAFRQAATRHGPIIRTSRAACYISPALESNVSPRAGAALLTVAAKHFPNCFLVWNPVGGGPLRSSGRPIHPGDGYVGKSLVVHERHNPGVTLGSPCIYSNDGDPISTSGYGTKVAQYQQCRAQFFWTSSFNCLAQSSGGPFVAPQLRTACTTPSEMRKIVAELLRAVK